MGVRLLTQTTARTSRAAKAPTGFRLMSRASAASAPAATISGSATW